jgi:hypothetical protein
MVKFVDLLFFVMLIMSTSISIFIYRTTTVSRKPFHKVYSEISSSEVKQNEKINLIEGLHNYLNDYSEEQILFDNLDFYMKRESVFWYDIFFSVSFTLIFFLVLGSNLPDAAKILLIFSTNTIIILLTTSTHSFLCRKLEICYPGRKSMGYVAANLARKNALIIFNSLILFSILLISFTLFVVTMTNERSTIQLFDSMISGISAFDVESINGNRFSLSTLFFTLAIGGTVVFSITNSHLKQKGKINEELHKQIVIYEKWFEENEKSLSVKLEDIFNKNVLTDFYSAVDTLSIKLNVRDFRRLKAPIQRFYSIVALITISYFTAILTVIAPSSFMNLLFLLFTICCGSFIFYAYKIFKDYSS